MERNIVQAVLTRKLSLIGRAPDQDLESPLVILF
jgi:hypothetical protein